MRTTPGTDALTEQVPVDLIIDGATVITVDQERRVLAPGAIAIKDGKIVAVGNPDDIARLYRADDRIDGRGMIAIPGLIDTHGHAGHSMLRFLACDSPAQWMSVVTPTYFTGTTGRFWQLDGFLSAAERALAGVTCGLSVLGSEPRADDPNIAALQADAYAEIGVRQVLGVGPNGLPWPRSVTTFGGHRRQLTHLEALETAEAVIKEQHHNHDGLISVALTPFTLVPSLDTSSATPRELTQALTEFDRTQAELVRDIAARHGVRIHTDAFGGQIRLAAIDPNGLLGPDVHLQHCFGLGLDEVEILAETGTHISHAPAGRAPVAELMSRGVNVSISTDGSSPERGFDLLAAARMARIVLRDRYNDPYLLPAGKLLEMITIDAATAMGMSQHLGSLEVGKRADIVLLDGNQPHLAPAWMPVHAVIHAAASGDVHTVLVNGRTVVDNGTLTAIPDLAALIAEANAEAHATARSNGLEGHLNPPGWGSLYTSTKEPVL